MYCVGGINFVGDARSQLADRFELLGLAQLRFQQVVLPARRPFCPDIPRRHRHAIYLASTALQRQHNQRKRDHLARLNVEIRLNRPAAILKGGRPPPGANGLKPQEDANLRLLRGWSPSPKAIPAGCALFGIRSSLW